MHDSTAIKEPGQGRKKIETIVIGLGPTEQGCSHVEAMVIELSVWLDRYGQNIHRKLNIAVVLASISSFSFFSTAIVSCLKSFLDY